MAKRRTRKQKERAAQRPYRSRTQSAPKPAASTPSAPKEPATPAQASQTAGQTAEQTVGQTEPDVWRHRERVRNIWRSLLVFAALALVQTGLWGVVQLGWLTLAMPV